MGFTAAMDDFDEARYAQGPSPLQVSPELPRHGARAAGEMTIVAPTWLRAEDDVIETVLPPRTAGAPVQVQGLTVGGRVRVRAEMQLLGALEIAGVLAVPGILSIEDDGYVREAARSLDGRSGRRAAEVGTPATAERRGSRRARDQLDALVDALHERGWVLGAASGHGVGLREDGTVVVLDLRGLMPHHDLAARHADRRWVDSVLTDPERTLRRRIQEPYDVEPGTGVSSDHAEAMGERADPGALGLSEVILERRGVEQPDSASVRSVIAARRGTEHSAMGRVEHGAKKGPEEGPAEGPGPSRLLRARTVRDPGSPGPSAAEPRRVSGFLPRVRELLLARRSRRTVLITAAAVLLAGTVLGTGTWLVMPSTGQHQDVQDTESDVAVAPAPPIDDAWALAAELAGARHAYVTGLSSQPAAAPGSDALAADIAVRAAYDGYTVEGGGPVVHEAVILQEPTEEGTALLQIIASSEEARLVASDGTPHTVPATPRESIELEISWDGTGWTVQSALPAPSSPVG